MGGGVSDMSKDRSRVFFAFSGRDAVGYNDDTFDAFCRLLSLSLCVSRNVVGTLEGDRQAQIW